MGDFPVHRELFLPPPAEESPSITPLVWASADPFWLEIRREFTGRVRYAIGSRSAADLDSLTTLFENTRPRVAFGQPVPCPSLRRGDRGTFAMASPVLWNHHFPLETPAGSDPGGLLLRILSSPSLRHHDVALQLLFQRVRTWESGIFSRSFAAVSEGQERLLRAKMEVRHAEAVYRAEMRLRINGPRPGWALNSLGVWLEQWTTSGGRPWRSWRLVSEARRREFFVALAAHDIRRFGSRKTRRDVSGTELSHLLSIPWADHHPECSYGGAPVGRPTPASIVGPVLLPSWTSTHRPRFGSRLVVGATGAQRVSLPLQWNHLAILGRTQTGKSTAALNLALQILSSQPSASVVVIEPTGTLVDGIVSRLPEAIASDSIEINPASGTFDRDGSSMVSVPLSLLQPPDRIGPAGSGPARWSEELAGNLVLAIRNAWGDESIGGRAELVLRALVQGLALTPGSNLVDAYHILSSKPALQRFVQTAPPGPLRDFLERHLPRLGYDFTMSSLDKVGKIATNSLLRIALCQRAQPVSFDRLLRHRLLLLNLSKPALGADGANFLGAIYLTQLWAALQRSGRPDHPVYLVVDEVHNYAVPTLADMLSEGAKFGLHVVAATQYLHRVPPKVRAALLGNVDAWLLFSLGTEDMDDAWKIVNGAGHGWVPQDLVNGLRLHEVALAASGDLVKLETLPSPPRGESAVEPREMVVRSSRRYAQPEDSEASPWLVGQEETQILLRTLDRRSRARSELGGDPLAPMPQLAAAMTRVLTAGDVDKGSFGETPRLTDRGSLHLRALEARRNEGEEHIETLVDFAIFLQARGIPLAIPRQIAGVLTPDGQFRWDGSTYNVEVECSTVGTAVGQVVRNVKKALASEFRVLVVLPDRQRVSRAVALLQEAFPQIRLWSDGVGLLWREGPAIFRPYQTPMFPHWQFLDAGSSIETPMPTATEERDISFVAETDPLNALLRLTVRGLLASGQASATSREIQAALPPAEQLRWTDEQIGMALNSLGLPNRRIRTPGARLRVYDLSALGGLGVGTGTRPSAGPGDRTGAGDASDGERAGPPRRSTDSPTENDGTGPRNPDGPAD